MAPKLQVRRALNLKPGDVIFLDYGEEGEPWHERIILAALGGAKYLVLTPDEDMYVEEIDTRHVADFKQGGPRGGIRVSRETKARHMQFIGYPIEKKKEMVKDFEAQDYQCGHSGRTGGAIVEAASGDMTVSEEGREAAEERALARAPPKKQ